MATRTYAALKEFGRFVKRQCLREHVLHSERAQRAGGYLLACTHVSHVEPLIVSPLLDRPVTWMARREFFEVPFLASMLRLTDAFSVDRQGVPVSAIRTAIRRIHKGDIVGIFPEGGCRKGKELAFRGGPIKQGVATIALHTGAPIVPLVVLGTHALNGLEPWLPGRYGQVWMNFGEAIVAKTLAHDLPRNERRNARITLAGEVQQAYISMYHELLHHAGLSDRMTP